VRKGRARQGWDGEDIQAEIDALPLHQRPPVRELGRRTEAAAHPFAGAAPAPRPAPYPGEGRFFVTGRMTGDVIGRAGERSARVLAPTFAVETATVTVERVGAAILVAAACPAARAVGIEPGSALTAARLVVPGLRVFPADRAGDRTELAAMARGAARRWSPAVALSGDGADGDWGLFVDLTGCAHLHGGEERWARGAVRVLGRMGVTARVGLADTAGAAWALARFGGTGVALCPAGGHPEAIAALPAASLRLDAEHVELLHRLGVRTVAQLAALPRKGVNRRFPGALRRLDQAMGAVPEPLKPVAVPEPVRVVRRFAEPVMTAGAIQNWIGELVPRFCDALERAGLGVRVAVLVAERVDGTVQTIRIGLSRASREGAHLSRLLLRRVEQVAPGWGLDSLGLHAVRVEPLGARALAPRLAGDGVADLAPLVDVVAQTASQIWRERPAESDVPERSLVTQAALAAPHASPARDAAADGVGQLDTRPPPHPWDQRWPRPARLLRRPEEVEHVIYEAPDGPPARFTWRGERYEVLGSDGPERIAGEWWRRLAETHAVRDYWRVEVADGQRFWLFRRGDGVHLETGDRAWFLHGLFG